MQDHAGFMLFVTASECRSILSCVNAAMSDEFHVADV